MRALLTEANELFQYDFERAEDYGNMDSGRIMEVSEWNRTLSQI